MQSPLTKANRNGNSQPRELLPLAPVCIEHSDKRRTRILEAIAVRHYGLDPFRVLIVTKSQARAAALVDLIAGNRVKFREPDTISPLLLSGSGKRTPPVAPNLS